MIAATQRRAVALKYGLARILIDVSKTGSFVISLCMICNKERNIV